MRTQPRNKARLVSKPRLFSLGQTVQTPNAAKQISNPIYIFACLLKHVTGDWGTVCPEDKRANDQAVKNGSRILSSYVAPNGTKFWIITEADRSSTCVLLPEDY